HDVAPVARGVADRQQDRAVLGPRAGERLLAPRVPVHGVVPVLEQVRAGLAGEAVGAAARPGLGRHHPPARGRKGSAATSATSGATGAPPGASTSTRVPGVQCSRRRKPSATACRSVGETTALVIRPASLPAARTAAPLSGRRASGNRKPTILRLT